MTSRGGVTPMQAKWIKLDLRCTPTCHLYLVKVLILPHKNITVIASTIASKHYWNNADVRLSKGIGHKISESHVTLYHAPLV